MFTPDAIAPIILYCLAGAGITWAVVGAVHVLLGDRPGSLDNHHHLHPPARR